MTAKEAAERERRYGLEAFAARHGLEFAPDLVEDLLDRRFYLASLWSDKVYGYGWNVMGGYWDGVPLLEMDYSAPTGAAFSGPNFGGTPTAGPFRGEYSVVKVPVPASFPPLYVLQKDWVTLLADEIDHLDHLHHERLEIMTGDRVFDESFEVLGSDREFAHRLFDPSMRRILLEKAKSYAFEFSGDSFIAYCGLLVPEELRWLCSAAVAVLRAIPGGLLDRYASFESA